MVYSNTRSSYAPLELEISQEDDRQIECKQFEWPFVRDDGFELYLRRPILGLAYFVLVLAALNIITIIGILIYLLVKSNTPIDSEFSFYKNTRFKECAAMVPDTTNCSAIEAAWKEDERFAYYADLGRFYILGTEVTANNGVSYDWCQMVSCFNGYKVIPSSANDSAMGPTTLSGWWYVILTTFSTVWTLRKSSPWFHRDFQTDSCRGFQELGVIDWVLHIWDLCGPIIGWWISSPYSIINPVPWTTFSLIAWTTTLRYSSMVQFHPYSCIMARVPRVRRALPWIFGLLAVLQCGATFYSSETDESMTGGTQKIYHSYSCLAADVASGPGTSSCSAEELCLKDWLFSYPYFFMPGDEGEGLPFGFCVASLSIVVPSLALIAMLKLFGTDRSFKKDYKRWSPLICLAGVAASAILVAGLFFPIMLGKEWNQRKPDALVAYDTDCQAVNIALSPWRFYLDVNKYARALRVVRLWFGV